jgi:hypothetical protein
LGAPDVPRPLLRAVVLLGEYLLHPFHNLGQPVPVGRLDVKSQQVILKTQAADFEGKPRFALEKPTKKQKKVKFAGQV